MTVPASPGLRERPAQQTSSTILAFVMGLPLALAVFAVVEIGPLRDTPWRRYLEHPVEIAELVLFCVALGCLFSKTLQAWPQFAACRRKLLPDWNGQPAAPAEAAHLQEEVLRRAGRLRHAWLPRRLGSVLEFVSQRGDTRGLDDQLRALADADALALDNSYSLVRFITWAIPILGFLGTVLGITQAIANVTPDVLEKSLNSVTEGLALAFDTTAVGLALTMVTMFLSFVTERLEQTALERVDHLTDSQLAHRFARGEQGDGVAAHVQASTQALLKTADQLIHRQAELWASALATIQRQAQEAGQTRQELLTQALEKALEKTLQIHQQRLTALEGQLQKHLQAMHEHQREEEQRQLRVLGAVAAQTEALAHLHDDGKQLLRLQDALHHNLAALQGAGSFEQAVQTLSAAIHLLTARVAPGTAVPTANRLIQRPGTAA